jgi:4-hydroxythreonine-4-phosphate dehydrogenase
MTKSEKPIVAITMGDPGGIGGEIIVKAYEQLRKYARPIVIGDTTVIESAVDICESDLEVSSIDEISADTFGPNVISVLDLDYVDDLEYGTIRKDYGQASLAYIERAIELATSGDVDAITTAPINKQSTERSGSDYAGHTGMLADYTDTENYSMMLVEGDLRVTHVSTHVSLEKACELVTTESVSDTIRVTDQALREIGVPNPKIAVAGLNPHASDGGLLGSTERNEITPAVEQMQEESINVSGPESPDTVYVSAAAGNYDCVVSMYHDQGHIPIKMLGFSKGGTVSGVNVTIGLPIVRTSVDHGTAFDIAGEGIASEESLVDAVKLASEIAQNRMQPE